MKFNFLLLAAISSLVSAIPLSEGNGCKELDIGCNLEHSKLESLPPKVPHSTKEISHPPQSHENHTGKRKCIVKAPKEPQPQPPKIIEPGLNSFEPTKENVKIIGRTEYMDGSLWVGHTDSGIEFKINGKTAIIVVSTDSIYGSLNRDTYAELYIFGDGKLVLDDFTSEATKEFKVEFDEEGEHTIRLLKVTECRCGSIYIDEIKSDSQVIRPTPTKDKKIEFIGDSITCAVGALEKEGNSLSTSANGINSYAYMVAQKLNVDYSIFAFGGYSVYGKMAGILPEVYEKLGVLDWNIDHPENTTIAMSSVDWDPTEFEPDLIVVNLGTNDAFYMNGVSEDKHEEELHKFTKAYEKFLAQIRTVHPKSEILCTYGMMGQVLYQQIEDAVHEYVKDSKDEHVNVFPLSEEDIEKNGPGFSGHPGINSHIFAANELIEEIQKLYGWIPDPNVDISRN